MTDEHEGHTSQAPAVRGLSSSGFAPRLSLRELLDRGDRIVLPGVPDALTARIAERAGFSACYVSGAGFANSQLGLPDVGLVSRADIAGHVAKVALACGIPVVVDGDTGYGGPLAVMHTVRSFEVAGASAIQLEDQQMPKRCGHFDGKSVVSVHDMVTNVRAAKLAASEGFVVIARTDAGATEGIGGAIDRARAYADAGADVVFVEAPQSLEEIELVARRLGDLPLVINIVEGGRTPQLSASDYFEMGYRIALFANFVMRTMMKTAGSALQHLVTTGETHSRTAEMLGWADRQELVGLFQVEQLEDLLELDGREAAVPSLGVPPNTDHEREVPQ